MIVFTPFDIKTNPNHSAQNMDVQPPPFIKTIEWDMMDKRKFFPLSMLSSFTVRCCFYPLTLIKTQLQVQFKNDVYSGMFDAAFKIYKSEGPRGLYKGFWISSVQIFSGVFYISTYEGVRHVLTQAGAGESVKSLISGGCASLVGQTIIVPFDVISQHAMVLGMGGPTSHNANSSGGKVNSNSSSRGSSNGVVNSHSRPYASELNPLGIKYHRNRSRLKISMDIAKEIMRQDGIRGYYRGYIASLMAYVPNSALWWTFYHLYQDNLIRVLPANSSHLLIQCVAGSLGGFTTTIITNPLDIVRARLQVQRLNSITVAFTELWAEEHMRMFFKGLSARLVQSAVFSFSIILGYETIKRISVNKEYKHLIKW